MMPAHTISEPQRLLPLMRGLAHLRADLDCSISNVVEDSRAVSKGALFIARRGGQVDAADYARDARGRQAAAMVFEGEGNAFVDAEGLLRIPIAGLAEGAGLIADRFFGQPSKHMPVIAVTGTNGKSSVVHHLAEAYRRDQGRPVGIIGTLGSGLSGALHSTGLTTPDCVSVHRVLAELLNNSASLAAIEASSHALEQARLAGVRIDTGVFTNLSRDHLDYHRDMRAYAAAKQRLFREFAPRLAVLNADDAAADGFRAALRPSTQCMEFSFRGAARAHVHGRILGSSRYGLQLQIDALGDRVRFATPLLGALCAQNLVCAFTVLILRGMDPRKAASLLSKVSPVRGRMEARGEDNTPLVVVDYAHTPGALEAVLSALAPLCKGNLWCVFGAGGDRDRGKRALMGAAVARAAQRLVITDDNPRGEDGSRIVADIMDGIPNESSVLVERDRARAIALAVSDANVEDIVLVAGKGHELTQTVSGEALPFDDLLQVEQALEAYRR